MLDYIFLMSNWEDLISGIIAAHMFCFVHYRFYIKIIFALETHKIRNDWIILHYLFYRTYNWYFPITAYMCENKNKGCGPVSSLIFWLKQKKLHSLMLCIPFRNYTNGNNFLLFLFFHTQNSQFLFRYYHTHYNVV
jgi:hypothetical protein